MTQEEKAKAYDEAFERARKLNSGESVEAPSGWTVCEVIFPELREGKDEKIIKAIVAHIKDMRYYDTYYDVTPDEMIAWLEKQIEQKPIDKVKPKFHIGDTMRTLQEASNGITDGMPVVVSIDNEYYHCTNKLIAIKDQDDYEFPPINMKQKSADKVEPKFHEGDCIIHYGTNNIYQVVAIIDNQYQLKYGDTYVIQTCAYIDRCARLFKPKFDVDDWIVNNTTHNVCSILKVENGQYICDNCSFPITKENDYHLWTIKDAKDRMATRLSQTTLQDEQKPKLAEENSNDSLDPLIDEEIDLWIKENSNIHNDNNNIVELMRDMAYYVATLTKNLYRQKSNKQKIEWKPSEKQMEALHELTLVGYISYIGQSQLLIELYNDLKKLI